MDVHVTLASKDCICYLILMFYSLFRNIFSLTGMFFDNFVCDHLNYCLLARLEIISGEPSDTMTGQIHFNSVTYRFWPVKFMR